MQTIASAAAMMRCAETSPSKLVEQCLARIDQLEEHVHAWVIIDREGAKADAVRLEKELAQGLDRGPLHGIPVGVKDIFDVFDMPTAAGSKLWANRIARTDSPVVARLRAAGAIILGKTVTTAYASFDPPNTRNPWNLERTPGGSSSGSAAAVASGMCFAALASQTGGSITRPAAYCGVASLKPTYGQVSVEGVLPLAPSLDHIGVLANSANDLEMLYDLIRDLKGGANAPIISRTSTLLIPCGIFTERMTPVMESALEQLYNQLQAAGYHLDKVELPPSFATVTKNHRLMMATEAAVYHEERLQKHPDDYPANITRLLNEAFASSGVEYARMLTHYQQLRQEMDAWFSNTDSIILTPATIDPAPLHTTTGDPLFNSPWSYAGLPTVSLPFTWTADGLPLSIQLVGPRFSDQALLKHAQNLEVDIRFERRTVTHKAS